MNYQKTTKTDQTKPHRTTRDKHMVTLVGGGEGAESRPQTRGPRAEGNTAGPYGAAVVEWSPGTTTRWAWLLLSPVGAGEGERRGGKIVFRGQVGWKEIY